MRHALTDALQWHIDQGVDTPIADAPVNRLAAEAPLSRPDPAPQPALAAPATDPTQPALAPFAPPPTGGSFSALRAKAVEAALACSTLEALALAIRAYDGLDVKRTATSMVFADGLPGARVMVVGEAPGADEDRQGLPFVGASGQLLDRMFACIGLSRTAQTPASALYISNILNWRPPGNRTPTEAEIALALPFIERHIALARPHFIVPAGGVAAKALLGLDQSISRLRGKLYAYAPQTPAIASGLPESGPIRVLPTFHPSFLLRTPLQKRKAWQDMLLLADSLAQTLS